MGRSGINQRSLIGGQALVLALIVLVVIGAGYWLLLSSRNAREVEAHRFAQDATERLLLKQDARFLNEVLAPHAQVLYLRGERSRARVKVGNR